MKPTKPACKPPCANVLTPSNPAPSSPPKESSICYHYLVDTGGHPWQSPIHREGRTPPGENLREGETKMETSNLTVEAIENWTWENTGAHRGKVPAMSKAERDLWCLLADRARPASDPRWPSLNRKMQFRAARDTDRIN